MLSLVGVPDLGGNKELVAGNIARIHRLFQRGAYCLFVLIQRGGIEVAVPQVDGFADNADAFIVIQLVGT